MTDTTAITTSAGAAAAAARRRARQRRRAAIYGALLLVGILVVCAAIIRAFTAGGTFISMSALVSRAGDALQDGDEVRFRNIIVGKLVGTGELVGDKTLLHLDVEPDKAAQIPGNVTASPVPTTLFGSQYVDLVEPASPSGQLVAGQTIPADTSARTAALQTALAEVDSLLTAIHPAQLDVALTNLAAALSGQGANLGSLIDNLDGYVRQLTPLTPQIQQDITRFASFVDELGANAPALLQTISNLTTTSQTLSSHQDQLRGLLSGGITLSDDLHSFLSANGDRFVTVVTDLRPVLGAIDQNTAGLTNGVLDLGAVARSWTTFLGPGHMAKLNLVIKNLDVGAAVTASLGGPTGRGAADQAFRSILNPAPYTASDCPRYPGANGPNCGGVQPLVTRSSVNGGSAGPVGGPAEQAALRAAVAQLLGIPPESVQVAISDVLVGPVLRGTTVIGL